VSRTGTPPGLAADRVEVLCELERWSDALPLLGQVLAGDPENDVAWCRLAQCHLGLGRPEAAMSAAGRAAALAPDTEWPHRLFSFAASSLGEHDLAIRAAREAVRLEPLAWPTHLRLAAALLRSCARAGRYDRQARAVRAEAGQAAAEALALAPNEAQVHLVHGSVAAAQGRPADAERAYRTALSLEPNSSSAHHLLAGLQLHRSVGAAGLADAVSGFATALAADPTAQPSRHSLETALRIFLGRAAYGLFAAAYLGQLFSAGAALWTRTVPLLLLAAPLLYVARFTRRLRPAPRAFLGRLLTRRPVTAATGLCVLAVLLMIAASPAPAPARAALAGSAAFVALTGRVMLFVTFRRPPS
jgi:tetratricopeptide (TPR) repeat protein